MHIPIFDVNAAATYQADSAIVQGILTMIALIVAVGVPWWQQRNGRHQDRMLRCSELAGLRLALHTEVGVIARECIAEQMGWSNAPRQQLTKVSAQRFCRGLSFIPATPVE